MPRELLVASKSVEQELLDSSSHPVIGAIVEMRNALWVPVKTRGHLHGVILACARKKHATLPKTFAETVAVELALALEVDDERRVSRERQQDFASVRSVLAALASAESPAVQTELVRTPCLQRLASGETQSIPPVLHPKKFIPKSKSKNSPLPRRRDFAGAVETQPGLAGKCPV